MNALLLLDIHKAWAWFVIIGNGLAGLWSLAAHRWPGVRSRALWWFTIYDTPRGKCERGDLGACVVWQAQSQPSP